MLPLWPQRVKTGRKKYAANINLVFDFSRTAIIFASVLLLAANRYNFPFSVCTSRSDDRSSGVGAEGRIRNRDFFLHNLMTPLDEECWQACVWLCRCAQLNSRVAKLTLELQEEQEMNNCLRANQSQLQSSLAEEERKGKESGQWVGGPDTRISPPGFRLASFWFLKGGSQSQPRRPWFSIKESRKMKRQHFFQRKYHYVHILTHNPI